MIRFFIGVLLGLPLGALSLAVFIAWACAKGDVR